jgi:hypothetical protein
MCFVHVGAPCGAVLLDRFLQVRRVVCVGVERDLPLLPAFALWGQFPAASVGVGDGLLAFLLLL